MTEDQEIRAKALEIAVLILGPESPANIKLNENIGGIMARYTHLADSIEEDVASYIQQGLPDQS